MKKLMITAYEAFDGERFESEQDCDRYERDNAWRRLIGLGEAQVAGAMGIQPVEADDEEAIRDIAGAIISCGYRIAGLRRQAKRAQDGNGGEPPAPPADEPPIVRNDEPEAPTAA